MKYVPTFEEFVNESLVESSHEKTRIVSTDKYALVEEGGPYNNEILVNTRKDQGKLIQTSDDKPELQARAAEMKKAFGRGYVPRTYTIIEMPAYIRKEVKAKYGE